jgi:hypothetical protein
MPDIRNPTRSLLVNRRLIGTPALEVVVPDKLHVPAFHLLLRYRNGTHRQKTRHGKEIKFGHNARMI